MMKNAWITVAMLGGLLGQSMVWAQGQSASAQESVPRAGQAVAAVAAQTPAQSGSTQRRRDGTYVFPYGSVDVTVLTAPLQLTDIELEAGEVINSVNVGDQVRFSIELMMVGSGNTATPHLLVKPHAPGLLTSLVIGTTQRNYYITLRSTNGDFYRKVGFSYPEREQAALQAQILAAQQARNEHSAVVATVNEQTGELEEKLTYLGDLNFAYEISGNPSWKPVRVYDDRQKVIIEMPYEMTYRKAPVLAVLNKEGGWFSDADISMINYRMQGTRFIVDGLFDRALLYMGEDWDTQDRVIITRLEP